MLHFPRPVQKAGQFLLGAGGISAGFESAEAHRQVKAFQLSNIIREFRELLRINAWGKAPTTGSGGSSGRQRGFPGREGPPSQDWLLAQTLMQTLTSEMPEAKMNGLRSVACRL